MAKTRARRPIQGLDIWQNRDNGFVVFRLHYTADPEKRTKEWQDSTFGGMPEDQRQREFEINFKIRAGLSPFPNFMQAIHIAEVRYNPAWPLYRSWDFGYRYPACLWIQVDPQTRRAYVLDELFGEKAMNISTYQFGKLVQAHHSRRGYGQVQAEYADIAGESRTSKSKEAENDIKQLMKLGIAKPLMAFVPRKAAYDALRNLLDPLADGKPGVIVGKRAVTMVDGLCGGLKLEAGTDRLPKDGYFEHVFDCFGYFSVGYYGNRFQRRYNYEFKDGKAVASIPSAKKTADKGPSPGYLAAMKEIGASIERERGKAMYEADFMERLNGVAKELFVRHKSVG